MTVTSRLNLEQLKKGKKSETKYWSDPDLLTILYSPATIAYIYFSCDRTTSTKTDRRDYHYGIPSQVVFASFSPPCACLTVRRTLFLPVLHPPNAISADSSSAKRYFRQFFVRGTLFPPILHPPNAPPTKTDQFLCPPNLFLSTKTDRYSSSAERFFRQPRLTDILRPRIPIMKMIS